jgi:hypothetical protein
MNADRNNVELCGRLVRDIKLCEKKSGATYAIITILTRRDKGDKGEFFEVFIWNSKIIECYGQYLKAGKRVSIKGWLSRTKENFYINLTEDYGLIIATDIKDLKKEEKASLAWIAALEEENEIYEKKLKAYEEKNNEGKSKGSSEAEPETKKLKTKTTINQQE